MKLYERFADKTYHTSIATTFGIDFDAYESIVLPRLRGAGCRNNIVIADSCMLTHALRGASILPRQAGKLYTVSGASAPGVFHPKVFLQLGRREGRPDPRLCEPDRIRPCRKPGTCRCDHLR